MSDPKRIVRRTWCRVHGDVGSCSCRPDAIITEAARQHYLGAAQTRDQRDKRRRKV